MLILILPSFFKFSIFPSVSLNNTYRQFFIKVFSETTWFRIMKSLTLFCLFSESVTTSDGYRRGYVSFAHFLLYLWFANNKRKVQTFASCDWQLFKMVRMFPLLTQEASEVAAVLFLEIISRHGSQRCLFSNRGRNFMSNLVKAMVKLFEIKRSYTSS